MSEIVDSAYDAYCTDRFPLPSADHIDKRVSRLGVPLPPEYKAYLLKHNGRYFNMYPSIDVTTSECPVTPVLEVMCGVGALDEDDELGNDVDLSLFDSNLPVRILPIGYTGGGHLVLLNTDPESEDYGSVWLKTIEISPDYEGGVYYLAPNINDFFGLLRASEE